MSKPPKNQTAPTLQTLAAGLGLTVRRVSQLKSLGMDCSSVSAAADWRKRKSASGEISVDELRKARFHLIEEQRRKIEIENSVRCGELVAARETFEAGLLMGTVLKGQLMKFMSDVVPQLEGLPCPGIYRVLKKGLHEILLNVSSNQFDTPELQAVIEDFRKTHPDSWTPPQKPLSKS